MPKQPGGTDNPIGYWSRLLNDGERAYDITYQECPAVVWAILLFLDYSNGCPATVHVYHDPLKSIMIFSNFTGNLTLGRLRLSGFEFYIIHRSGIKHQTEEALSRLKTRKIASPKEEEILELSIIPYNSTKGEKTRVLNKHNCISPSNKKGVKIPGVYATATATRSEDKNRPEHRKNFYSSQRKCHIVARCRLQCDILNRHILTTGMAFRPAQHKLMERFIKLLLLLYGQIYCTMHIIILYLIIQVKDICTTV